MFFTHFSLGRHALLATVLLSLAACQKAEPPQEPIRAVKVMSVGEPAQGTALEFSGEIRARVESALGFRVAGKILSRPAEIGQRVKAGELLAQLDPQDYRVTADAAAAQLLAAQSSRDAAEADFKRYQNLQAQGFISAAELERREASLKAARAQWQQAQAQHTVQGNQAAYTRLVADGAGVVTSIDAQPGQVIAAGQVVLRLALDGPRDVVFAVPEDKLPSFKNGGMVQVRLWGSQSWREARIRDVAGSADPVTRTFVVKAVLTQASKDKTRDEAEPVLGSTVTVRQAAVAAQTAGQRLISLPTSALREEGGKTTVWLLDSGSMTVKLQPVEVRAVEGNEVVVTSGLNPGDEVVLSGVHVLTPGQKVTRFNARQ